MIYGWSHCGYYELTYGTTGAIEKASDSDSPCPIKKLHRYYVATDPGLYNPLAITLEGRKMNLIGFDSDFDKDQYLGRKCKTAITDIVLENYKRKKEGLPLIPIVFAIDITGNPQPYSIDKICSKKSKINKQVTHKEIRRAYKLCTHPNPHVRAIALETFKFVKVCVKDKAPTLEQIPAPWGTTVESPEKVSAKFAAFWEERRQNTTSKPKPDKHNWSKQLEQQMARYDRVSRLQTAMVGQALQTKSRLDILVPKPGVANDNLCFTYKSFRESGVPEFSTQSRERERPDHDLWMGPLLLLRNERFYRTGNCSKILADQKNLRLWRR